LGLLVLTACGGLRLPPLDADQQRFQQQIDGVTITLDSSKAPRVNQTETLRITLHDAQGHPITTADVYVDLAMDMLCMNSMTPVGVPTGGGSYAVQTVYQMAGDWRITVAAQVGAHRHQAVFTIPVHE
jgi:nitrogen fixation protein FixH